MRSIQRNVSIVERLPAPIRECCVRRGATQSALQNCTLRDRFKQILVKPPLTRNPRPSVFLPIQGSKQRHCRIAANCAPKQNGAITPMVYNGQPNQFSGAAHAMLSGRIREDVLARSVRQMDSSHAISDRTLPEDEAKAQESPISRDVSFAKADFAPNDRSANADARGSWREVKTPACAHPRGWLRRVMRVADWKESPWRGCDWRRECEDRDRRSCMNMMMGGTDMAPKNTVAPVQAGIRSAD